MPSDKPTKLFDRNKTAHVVVSVAEELEMVVDQGTKSSLIKRQDELFISYFTDTCLLFCEEAGVKSKIMELKILSEPKFQILKDGKDYVFYNSVRHFSCRISLLDLSIFNLIYSLGEIEVILSYIPQKYHEYVKQVYNAAKTSHALDVSPSFETKSIEYKEPSTYYLHLTYKCNLDCIYCYNKKIRSSQIDEFSLEEWFSIIDKILPYASKIIITGGEPFLYNHITEIILYIKNYNKNINIEIISNCMIDFSNNQFDKVFANISQIIFSCDNISNKNQPRKNFKPDLFKKNIVYIKSKYPNLPTLVSSVYSCGNYQELGYIQDFCSHQHTDFRSVLIVPGNKDEITLLPPFEEYCSTLYKSHQQQPRMRLHCGAAIGILSINPRGEVYPCQSLMHKKFLMGSLKTSTMHDIMQSDVFSVFRHKFSVDNIPICNKCNVKYICAGGCRNATINTEGSAEKWPKTLCQYYREQALNALRSIPLMGEINLLDNTL